MKERFRPWTAQMAVILAIVCLLWIPGAQVRAEGLSTGRVVTSRLISRFTLVDSTPIVVPLMALASDPNVPAFCLTPHAVEPYPSSPVGYVGTGPEALFGSEAFIRGVTAIVQHGYPSEAVFDGVTYSPEEAYYATTVAIWWLHAELGMPDAITPISGAVSNGHEGLFQVARRLYEIGRTQLLKTVSVSAEPAHWIWRAGRLECSTAVTQHHTDTVGIASVPAKIQATLADGILSLATSDLTVLEREVEVALRGTSRFANENLYWLAPDSPAYQTVLAVGGASLFSAACQFVPEGRSGSLEILKTGREGLPVTGSPAVFQLIDAAAGTPCGFTAEAAGRFRFGGTMTDLPTEGGVLRLSGIPESPGGWLLREIAAPEGHLPAGEDIPVVPGDPATPVEVSNQYEMVRVRIIKRDAQTGESPQGDAVFEGAVFEVWHRDDPDFASSPEDRRERVEIPAGSDRVETRLLRGGSAPGFFVREIAPPAGYLPAPETMEVLPGSGEDDMWAVLTVENTVIRGQIVLEKRGEAPGGPAGGEGATIPLPDVTFRIFSSSTGKIADAIVTGADGIARSGWLPYGRYRVEELPGESNAGYLQAPPFEVELCEPEAEVSVVVDNVAVRLPVELGKGDAVTGEPVADEGFSLVILDADGHVLRFPVARSAGASGEVLHADSEGRVTVPGGLTMGSYYARELSAPAGYVRCEEPIPFEVVIGEERICLEIPNEPTALEILKTDPTGAPLSGALFQLEYATGELCRFAQLDGVYRPDAGGDPVLRSGGDGMVRIHALPVGDYRLTETEAPAGYLLPQEASIPVSIGIRSRVTAPAAIAWENEPEPTPEPTPVPEPTPEPTPVPEPTPEPTPVPEPTPKPTPVPEPTLEPTPAPTTRITLPTEPIPQAEPIPEAGEKIPFARTWLPAALWAAALTAGLLTRAGRSIAATRPGRRTRRPW
ncbi:MAG: hypothetical protein GX153_06115 [Clostridiaceae bacterium]|nr:hypothetical protein [Clostridiaceae bacterium]